MITDEYIGLADDQLKSIKQELRDEAQVKGITAYGISKETGMNMQTAYRTIDPDTPSYLHALIVAGLAVGLELTWRPVE